MIHMSFKDSSWYQWRCPSHWFPCLVSRRLTSTSKARSCRGRQVEPELKISGGSSIGMMTFPRNGKIWKNNKCSKPPTRFSGILRCLTGFYCDLMACRGDVMGLYGDMGDFSKRRWRDWLMVPTTVSIWRTSRRNMVESWWNRCYNMLQPCWSTICKNEPWIKIYPSWIKIRFPRMVWPLHHQKNTMCHGK